jgi:predicted AlkP superfamily phosphohydrolase/phosphomutase
MTVVTLILFGGIAPLSCSDDGPRAHERKLVILAFDGMDPKLCTELMDAGRLPTLARLRKTGGFKPLGTSTPPQSPVAWSSLITGTNPGYHGIFDFIHRDPETYIPYASTAKITGGGWPLHLGRFVFQLKSSEVVNLRHFWEYLTEAGVPASIYRMPADYPPDDAEGAHFCCLTDMGTPDIRGTNGEFSYYTDGPFDFDREITGGHAYRLVVDGDTGQGVFRGPIDSMVAPVEGEPPVSAETPFTIYRDPTEPTARIDWADRQLLLQEGEWSDWQPITFEMGPRLAAGDYDGGAILSATSAICRFHLKQLRPNIELYVTPFNIDPLDPALPVSQPPEFSAEVAARVGRYYTQGLPEDTKALSNHVLSRDEFLAQAEIVLQERLKLLDDALEQYQGGVLFFYFGTTDQIGHMFWGARQDAHPALTDEERAKYRTVMDDVYVRADAVVAKVLERIGDATLLITSDHGFESFTRGFNLNTWLAKNGYATPDRPDDHDSPLNFDFARTRAYGLGINGLYINLRHRERDGIVDPGRKQALIDEITAKLLEATDPATGRKIVKAVYQSDKIYAGPNLAIGPDLQIGYARTFRASWATVLGAFPAEIVEDNTNAWCADHCIATDLVPGVLFSNRPIGLADPTLEDIAPTVLTAFDLPVPEQMTGRNVFSTAPPAAVADGKE